jgi:hypothetical protein
MSGTSVPQVRYRVGSTVRRARDGRCAMAIDRANDAEQPHAPEPEEFAGARRGAHVRCDAGSADADRGDRGSLGASSGLSDRSDLGDKGSLGDEGSLSGRGGLGDKGSLGDADGRDKEGDGDAGDAGGGEPTLLTDPEVRTAEARRYHAVVNRANASDGDTWSAATPKLRAAWEEHVERYPAQERTVPATRPDGSWGTATDRRLTAEQNADASRACADIRGEGKAVIFPAMDRIEAADPRRHLAGLGHMLKGEDRLKEKAADVLLVESNLTVRQALAKIPDVVRFTLVYSQQHYTQGVIVDVQRLKEEGFELVKLKNLWAKENYKGVNSQWRNPDTNLRFEVQFHTPESFAAKELTHEAYERLRVSGISQAERSELEAYQKRVNELIAIPPGSAEIEEFPRKNG